MTAVLLLMADCRQWCRVTLVDDEGEVLADWALAGESNPKLEAVNLIARWAVIARRAGARVRIGNACPELFELIELAGLPVEMEG